MSSNKNSSSKYPFQFDDKKTYYLLKIVVNVVFLLLIKPLLVYIVDLFDIKNNTLRIVFIITLIVVVSWILLNGFFESIFLSSLKIEDNMEKMPKIGSKSAIVEYDLFNEISPSEAGILLYRRAEISNLTCIIYKRIQEGVIKIRYIHGDKCLEVIKQLPEDAPDYEKFLFELKFKGIGYIVDFNNTMFDSINILINDRIMDLCVRKGYIIRGFVFANSPNHSYTKVPFSVGCSILIIFCFTFVLMLSGAGVVLLPVYIPIVLICLPLFLKYVSKYKSYDFKLTSKGEEMLVKIKGYKYYLEHCEEELISNDLENSKFYNKHLPYAIALKLNRKIIDQLS